MTYDSLGMLCSTNLSQPEVLEEVRFQTYIDLFFWAICSTLLLLSGCGFRISCTWHVCKRCRCRDPGCQSLLVRSCEAPRPLLDSGGYFGIAGINSSSTQQHQVSAGIHQSHGILSLVDKHLIFTCPLLRFATIRYPCVATGFSLPPSI